jgi:hypothetical protein
MRKAADRLDIIGGKRNSLGMLRQYLEDFKVKQTVAAWGRGAPTLGAEAARVIPEMFCLAKNKDNSPRHPLYIPYSETLKPFNCSASGNTGVSMSDSEKTVTAVRQSRWAPARDCSESHHPASLTFAQHFAVSQLLQGRCVRVLFGNGV